MSRSAKGVGTPYLVGWAAITQHLRDGLSWSGRERDLAYLRVGSGQFLDASWVLGLDEMDDGRTTVSLDIDHDGDLDLLRVGRGAPRLRLLENQADPEGRAVFLRLIGEGAMRDAIGAIVHVEDSLGRRHLRGRRAGEGFLSQAGPWLHVGLGEASVEEVVVQWPDGMREVFAGVKAGRSWTLRRGTGVARESWPPSHGRGVAAEVESLPGEARSRTVLASPLPIPSLPAVDARGQGARLLGPRPVDPRKPLGDPTVLLLWSVDCATCQAEVPRLSEHLPALQQQGVRVVAGNVDPEESQLRAQGLLLRSDWSGVSVRLEERALEVLEVVETEVTGAEVGLKLPMALLLDGAGRLVALHRRELELEALQRDLGFCNDVEPSVRFGLASLFPGRRLAPLPEGGARDLVRALRALGYEDEAQEVERATIQVQGAVGADVLLPVVRTRWQQGARAEARQLARTLLEREPNHQALRRVAAGMASVEEDWAEALDHFQALTRIDASDAAAAIGVALALAHRGEQDAAFAAIEDVARRWPEHAARARKLLADVERK